ncbi:hypothetical protein KYC_20149 [Achromobacter arsenitoxydans SY8]|uniref:Uncharacterized protein n=1 Tax=Achromobacter arsenitoxydans SY8 TaxID=477184 RepID=H0FB73_9BURK|nr:hypothetical protein KYC_20149 [Achromobacter arsenitoxydans SY8]
MGERERDMLITDTRQRQTLEVAQIGAKTPNRYVPLSS